MKKYPIIIKIIMKHLILLSFVFIVANGLSSEDSSKITKNLMKVGEECRKETGANADDVTRIMQKKLPTRKEGKCLLFCVHQRIGFQESSGKKNISGIENWLKDIKSLDATLGDKMEQIANTCVSIVDDSGDGCEVAGVIFDCYMGKAKELGVPMMI